MPDDLTALLYRERFGLSTAQMADEPLETIRYWVALEEERQKEQKRP